MIPHELEPAIATMSQKAAEADKIARDTAAFIAAGGTIQTFGNGSSPLVAWDGEWLGPEDAARRLGVSVTHLKNSIVNRSLFSCQAPVSYLRGGRRMWPVAALDEWVRLYGHHINRRTFKDGKRGVIS